VSPAFNPYASDSDGDWFITPHEQEHLLLNDLAQYPPLTKKKVRRRYRDLIKEWRHATARRKYGELIKQAQEYRELSRQDPDNAHMLFFRNNKQEKGEDYLA